MVVVLVCEGCVGEVVGYDLVVVCECWFDYECEVFVLCGEY